MDCWFQESDSLSFDLWEQRLAQEALRRTHGDIPAAAELMGISRASLYRKLKNGLIKIESSLLEIAFKSENAT